MFFFLFYIFFTFTYADSEVARFLADTRPDGASQEMLLLKHHSLSTCALQSLQKPTALYTQWPVY